MATLLATLSYERWDIVDHPLSVIKVVHCFSRFEQLQALRFPGSDVKLTYEIV